MRTILVTGGTGTLGRFVVRRLSADGHPVRVLSRRERPAGPAEAQWVTGDLRADGDAVRDAVRGVQAIVHCATDPLGARDVRATGNLLAAARTTSAGVPHLVYVSIVGVDRVPLPYYRTKLRVERMVEASGLPWTILRATPFHELVIRICRALRWLPVLPVPAGTKVQPIAAEEVAGRLAELASGTPMGRVADLGGPRAEGLDELVRTYLRASGRRRIVLPVPVPGATARAYRDGRHLAPAHPEGTTTFEGMLARTAATGRRL